MTSLYSNPSVQKLNGRPHKCIQCNTTGTVLDTTRKVEKWVKVEKGESAPCAYSDCRGCQHCGRKPIQVHPDVTCPTCKGEGYTKVEYEPIKEEQITVHKERKISVICKVNSSS